MNATASPALGAKVYFAGEKRPYRVRARDDRYAVCTKPAFGTVIYTVIDVVQAIRGTENLIFGMGAESDEDCEAMLKRISSGSTEISYRNRVPLNVLVRE